MAEAAIVAREETLEVTIAAAEAAEDSKVNTMNPAKITELSQRPSERFQLSRVSESVGHDSLHLLSEVLPDNLLY